MASDKISAYILLKIHSVLLGQFIPIHIWLTLYVDTFLFATRNLKRNAVMTNLQSTVARSVAFTPNLVILFTIVKKLFGGFPLIEWFCTIGCCLASADCYEINKEATGISKLKNGTKISVGQTVFELLTWLIFCTFVSYHIFFILFIYFYSLSFIYLFFCVWIILINNSKPIGLFKF